MNTIIKKFFFQPNKSEIRLSKFKIINLFSELNIALNKKLVLVIFISKLKNYYNALASHTHKSLFLNIV